MSQPSEIRSDDSVSSDFSDSPGRRLRAQRQAKGIEIERIAAQLHLRREVVEALERDEHDKLPSPVFVAGYLRNYARLLGTDSAPIIDAYKAMCPAQDLGYVRPGSSVGGRKGPRSASLGLFVGIAMTVVAVGLAAFWWMGGGSSDEPLAGLETEETVDSQVTTAAGGTPLGDGGADDESAQPTAAPVDSFGSTVAVPPDAIPLRSSQPSVPPAPTAASAAEDDATIPAASLPTEPPAAAPPQEPAAPEPPSQEVVLQFSGTSWVDVRDAAGDVVLNGEMRAGDRRTLTGEPPFKLVIGNAAATQLTVGGKPFDLNRRQQGNVARFSLNPSQPES